MKARELVGSVIETVIKVVVTIVVVMAVYRFSVTAYDYGVRVFAEEPMSASPGESVTVVIPDGKSTKEVGDILEKNGLIRDANLFVIQEMLSGLEHGLAPGTYELNTAMTIGDMIKQMEAKENTSSDE